VARTVQSAEELLDLAKLSDALLKTLIEEMGGVSGTVWIFEQDQSFRKVFSSGKAEITDAIDPGEVIHRHEGISAGMPFFEQRKGKIILNSVFLPMLHHDRLSGLVHLELKTSSRGKAIEEEILQSARKIVEEFSPFLNSALTFDRVRRNPLKDLESDSYNEIFVLDFLSRQIALSQRYKRRLGLVSLEFEGVEGFQRNQTYRLVQAMLRDTSETLQGIVRDYDIVSHVGNFRFFFGLPDSDSLGCRITIERIRKGFEKLEFLGKRFARYGLTAHFGFACYPEDGSTVDALLMKALERGKESRQDPFNRIQWNDKSFWDMVEMFTGDQRNPDLLKIKDTNVTEFNTGFNYLLQETVANDICLHPDRRGLLFIGTDNMYITEALLQKNTAIAKAATRTSVFGDMSGVQSLRDLNVSTITVSPDHAASFQFILYLTDLNAYGLLTVHHKGDLWKGIHTSHDKLVEKLIFKLREEYSLQDQI
jgi:GGDEF domain-containing protein